MTDLQRLAKESELTQRELAYVMGTCLLTAHRYANGNSPHAMWRNQYNKVVSVLQQCMDDKTLPIKYNVRIEWDKRRAVLDTIKEMINA